MQNVKLFTFPFDSMWFYEGDPVEICVLLFRDAMSLLCCCCKLPLCLACLGVSARVQNILHTTTQQTRNTASAIKLHYGIASAINPKGSTPLTDHRVAPWGFYCPWESKWERASENQCKFGKIFESEIFPLASTNIFRKSHKFSEFLKAVLMLV